MIGVAILVAAIVFFLVSFYLLKRVDKLTAEAITVLSGNQVRVAAWEHTVFDAKTMLDAPERALRMAEEAIELVQACGGDRETVRRLVDYVFSRPPGKPAQEIAGCMVTIYATAISLAVDADAAFEMELERIRQPEVIERIRRRQHEKREALVAPKPSDDLVDVFLFEEVEIGGGYHTYHVCSTAVERSWSEPYNKSSEVQYRSRVIKVRLPGPPEWGRFAGRGAST